MNPASMGGDAGDLSTLGIPGPGARELVTRRPKNPARNRTSPFRAAPRQPLRSRPRPEPDHRDAGRRGQLVPTVATAIGTITTVCPMLSRKVRAAAA
jgi:hypothetical protein